MYRFFIALCAISAIGFIAAPEPAFAKNKAGKHCPPGLAKKTPACVPPGQAKKGVTAEEWQANRDEDDDDYDVGDRLDDEYVVLETGDRVTIDGTEYVVVRTGNGTVLKRDDDWYRLPGDRDDYVRVGDSLIRVDPKTRAVLDVIELADLILG